MLVLDDERGGHEGRNAVAIGGGWFAAYIYRMSMISAGYRCAIVDSYVNGRRRRGTKDKLMGVRQRVAMGGAPKQRVWRELRVRASDHSRIQSPLIPFESIPAQRHHVAPKSKQGSFWQFQPLARGDQKSNRKRRRQIGCRREDGSHAGIIDHVGVIIRRCPGIGWSVCTFMIHSQRLV